VAVGLVPSADASSLSDAEAPPFPEASAVDD
jgi:hypothetical protein